MKTEVLLLLFAALNNLQHWLPLIVILTVIAWIAGTIFIIGCAHDKHIDDEKQVAKTAALEKELKPFVATVLTCLTLSCFILTVIPTERQMIAIYVLPKVEAGAAQFGKTWGNLPPKLSQLLEAKLDKALKETLGEPNEPSPNTHERTENRN